MKKTITYLLIIFSVLGILLDLAGALGIIKLLQVFSDVNASPSGLSPLYFKLAFIFIVHIVSLFYSIALFKRKDVSASGLEKFSPFVLLILITSFYFLLPVIRYSLAIYSYLKINAY